MSKAAAITLALCLLPFGCAGESGSLPSPSDMLMAARTHAASQSDQRGDDTHWCESGEDPADLAARGAVVLISGNRYRVTGCVVGSWAGRRIPRRFVAVVERRPIHLDVREIPILEFRFLD